MWILLRDLVFDEFLGDCKNLCNVAPFSPFSDHFLFGPTVGSQSLEKFTGPLRAPRGCCFFLFFYKNVAARHICLGAQVPRGLALRERLQLEYLNINTAPTILFFDIFSTGGKEIRLWAVFIFKYS